MPAPFWADMLRQLAVSAALGLLLWGWFAWTLTPVERHYFGAYALSSVHAKMGADQDAVTWILKTGPKKKLAIAQPEDLVSGPETGGNPPFQLSAKARAEGWTGVDWSVPEMYPAASTRAFLGERFFDGHSFWALIFQPLEPPLIVFCLWRMFALWRQKLARDGGAGWDSTYRPTSWHEDLGELARITFVGTKTAATGAWKWAGRWVQERRGRGETATVAPFHVLQTVTASRVTPNRISLVPVTEPAPASNPPAAPVAEPKPVPEALASPFGPGSGEGEPEREWDLSQWID